MTLDEEINYCEEVADFNTKEIENGTWRKDSMAERYCIECANERRQLAEWLKELKIYKEQQPCKDVISREDALKALCQAVHKNDDNIPCPNQRVSCLWNKTKVQDYAEEILKLPSVIPQQKTGWWIEDAETYYKAIHVIGEPDENTPIFLDDIACSECLAKFSVKDNETKRFKCCPNCGIKMEVK
jgi:hypothetical protein